MKPNELEPEENPTQGWAWNDDEKQFMRPGILFKNRWSPVFLNLDQQNDPQYQYNPDIHPQHKDVVQAQDHARQARETQQQFQSDWERTREVADRLNYWGEKEQAQAIVDKFYQQYPQTTTSLSSEDPVQDTIVPSQRIIANQQANNDSIDSTYNIPTKEEPPIRPSNPYPQKTSPVLSTPPGPRSRITGLPRVMPHVEVRDNTRVVMPIREELPRRLYPREEKEFPTKNQTNPIQTTKKDTTLEALKNPSEESATDFEKLMPETFDIEGGYVNNPNDARGHTNRGITLSTFQGTAGSILGMEPTLENLKKLSKEDATKIYEKAFWKPSKAQHIADKNIQRLYWDYHVNSSPKAAIQKMQEAINQTGGDVKEDGVMGPKTVDAINNHSNPSALYDQYKQNRIDYYHELAKKRPKNQANLKGWLNRMDRF